MLASIGRVVLAVTLALGIVAGSTTASRAATSTTSTVRTVAHPYWSGYVAVACGTCQLRYVSASWRVSAVNCAASPLVAWDDSWVGLDGFTSGSVEQIGTAGVCTQGQPDYLLWWEMYPNPGQLVYEVHAGDVIRASVYYDAASHRYRLTLDDVTAGLVIDTRQPCPRIIRCGNADAEVVSEAPNAGADVPLADFGTTGYSSIRVTSRNGTRGGMASTGLWSVVALDLVRSGHLLASPGPATGAAFTETWHAAQ